jgi:hypothetical protein
MSAILTTGVLSLAAPACAQGVHPAVVTTTPYTGFNAANAIAVDAAGNIFVANGNNNTLVEQPVNGGAQIILVSNLTFPLADAVDSAGNAYVGSHSGNLFKVPVGGGAAVDILAGNNCPAMPIRTLAAG